MTCMSRSLCPSTVSLWGLVRPVVDAVAAAARGAAAAEEAAAGSAVAASAALAEKS